MDIEQLNLELDELLKVRPDLISVQAELSYKLAMMDNQAARVMYTFELMLDSFDQLKEKCAELEKLVDNLNKMK